MCQNAHLPLIFLLTLASACTRFHMAAHEKHNRNPPPFPHIMRGEVRISAVWGSGPVFPLAWHPAHINNLFLQKPLMQRPVLTVF